MGRKRVGEREEYLGKSVRKRKSVFTNSRQGGVEMDGRWRASNTEGCFRCEPQTARFVREQRRALEAT